MTDLRMEPVVGDGMLEQWWYVHTVIVPPAAMSAEDVRERGRRYRLGNAYLGDTLVGCSTVRPPDGEGAVATVIARVLPDYRRRGFGTALYEKGLDHARVLGARVIETCVLAVNGEGTGLGVGGGSFGVSRV